MPVRRNGNVDPAVQLPQVHPRCNDDGEDDLRQDVRQYRACVVPAVGDERVHVVLVHEGWRCVARALQLFGHEVRGLSLSCGRIRNLTRAITVRVTPLLLLPCCSAAGSVAGLSDTAARLLCERSCHRTLSTLVSSSWGCGPGVAVPDAPTVSLVLDLSSAAAGTTTCSFRLMGARDA